MLTTMRSSWLLFALLALVALTSAINVDIDGIEAYLHRGVKRQASGTGNASPTDEPDSTPTPTPTATPTSSPRTSNPPATTTNSPAPTTSQDDPTTQPTTNQPASPTNAATSQRGTTSAAPNTSASPTEGPSPTTAASSRAQTPITRTSSFTSTSIQTYQTVYKTISNGQQIDVTATASSTAVITGSAEVTELPSPQDGGNSGSSGLSPSNKKIIGGVVGGVGGAILLGGIALVCWRIWGRKKRVSEDDDDLMAGTGAALGDKPSTGASPFQSNLEQYHNPGGRPNAAANF